ncbi:MAG: GNAT family N-acetyltransferase [Planctomycetales bacterium]|jgi:ribosomal protein S18 acetylase RimI-like enzyme|nr:GNAT family N-acetyltransferase [Planctomycetales bacterium]
MMVTERSIPSGHGVTIRAATFQDWPIIVQFNTLLAEETEQKRLHPETIAAGVQTLLLNPQHGRYFVACLESQVVGQIMHTREWSDWRNGEIWWLQSVYVLSEFRRRGVFRELLAYMETSARSSAIVVGIRLYVELHNARAQDAYLRLGFKQADYRVMQQLFGNET